MYGDSASRGEAESTESADQGLVGQAGMQETEVAVSNWKVVSCLQDSARCSNFLSKMIDYSTKAKNLEHWIKLTMEFLADLAWWEAFLPS